MRELKQRLQRASNSPSAPRVAGEGALSLRPKDQGHERQQTNLEIEVIA